MKKGLSLLKAMILLLFISLFFACDNGSTGTLEGSWILVRSETTGMDNGTPINYYSTFDNTDVLEYRLLEIASSVYTSYWYEEDEYNYRYYTSNMDQLNGSGFYLNTTEYSYSFSGNQLILEYTYQNGADYSNYKRIYSQYNGLIPPPEWTSPSNIDLNYVTGTTITVDAVAIDSSLTAGDIDWYSFAATLNTEYTITTGSGENLDTVLALYDVDGTTYLDSNDDYSTVRTSQIVWTCPAAGTYYFKVRGYFEDTNGDYTISVIDDI